MFQILAGDSRPAQPLDPDLTALAGDYAGSTKTLTFNVAKAATSGGLTIQNSSGASVLLLGAGPSQGITAYGQINGTSVSLSAGLTCTTVTASTSMGLSGNSPASYLAIGVTNAAANGYAQINLTSGTLGGALNVATGLFYKFYHNGSVPWQWESSSGVVGTLTAAGALTVSAGITCTTVTASSTVLAGSGLSVSGSAVLTGASRLGIVQAGVSESRLLAYGSNAATQGSFSFYTCSSNESLVTALGTWSTSGFLVGTDPGGSELLRVGGSFRMSGTTCYVGAGASATNLYVDGSSSGAAGGAFISVRNGGASSAILGNWSNIHGGSYDGGGAVWGASSLRLGASAHTNAIWIDSVSGNRIGFYGVTPVARAAAAAAATDAATTQTLANSLRTILINLGLAS